MVALFRAQTTPSLPTRVVTCSGIVRWSKYLIGLMPCQAKKVQILRGLLATIDLGLEEAEAHERYGSLGFRCVRELPLCLSGADHRFLWSAGKPARGRWNRYATLREPRRLGLSAGTNRISMRLPSTSAMRRNIAKECPS